MADSNPRKDRLIELSKNNNRTPVENTEFEALGREFPETFDTFSEKQAAQPAQGRTAGGQPGVVSAGNPTGRGK